MSQCHVGHALEEADVNEAQVEAFWAAHPCGEQFVAGADDVGYEAFFQDYDRFRYERESHGARPGMSRRGRPSRAERC